jgi:hypothetical protein
METRERAAIRALGKINAERMRRAAGNGVTASPLAWEPFWTDWKAAHPDPNEMNNKIIKNCTGILEYSIEYMALPNGSYYEDSSHLTINCVRVLQLLLTRPEFKGALACDENFVRLIYKLRIEIQGRLFSDPVIVRLVGRLVDLIDQQMSDEDVEFLYGEAAVQNTIALKAAKLAWFDMQIKDFAKKRDESKIKRDRAVALAKTRSKDETISAAFELSEARARIAELEKAVCDRTAKLADAQARIAEFQEVLA